MLVFTSVSDSELFVEDCQLESHRGPFRLPIAAGSAKGDVNDSSPTDVIVGFKADNNTLV